MSEKPLELQLSPDRRVVPAEKVVPANNNYPQAGPKIAPREVHNLESERRGVGRVQPGDPSINPGTTSISHKGWYSRGYLPHFDAPGVYQHITFHLADSLPRTALDRMQREIELLSEDKQTVQRRKRLEQLLDGGLGSCVLRSDDCAGIVEESLLFGDEQRYRLLAWCIMPNHVHVLIEQLPGWPLAKVVQSWKRHTSREIHRLQSQAHIRQIPNALWQRDYWDRFIRDERHFQAAKRYIENNPVAAGLVGSAEDWPWGSARFGDGPSTTRRSQGGSDV